MGYENGRNGDAVEMKLYVYVMTNDDGTAPCIDNGLLTLSCCKPKIRHNARENDWIMGLAGVGLAKKAKIDEIEMVGKIVYIAQVTKKTDWKAYGDNAEYRGRADNAYFWDKKGQKFKRKLRFHDDEDMKKDVKEPVLISEPTHFRYFGKNAKSFPERYAHIREERIRHSKGLTSHTVYPKPEFDENSVRGFIESMVKTGEPDVQDSPCLQNKEARKQYGRC